MSRERDAIFPLSLLISYVSLARHHHTGLVTLISLVTDITLISLTRNIGLISLTQVSVSCSGEDFKHAVIDSKNRNIKGASSQVENQNSLFIFFVQTVSQGSGGSETHYIYEASVDTLSSNDDDIVATKRMN